MPTTPQLAVAIFILCIYIKNVEPALMLVPRFVGSRIAQVVETSNAESPT